MQTVARQGYAAHAVVCQVWQKDRHVVRVRVVEGSQEPVWQGVGKVQTMSYNQWRWNAAPSA